VVHFFRRVLSIPVVSKEILSQRTDYQTGQALRRNHHTPIVWAEGRAQETMSFPGDVE
jgi:hypothetical protein